MGSRGSRTIWPAPPADSRSRSISRRTGPARSRPAARGALSSLSAAHQRVLTGRQFFPELLSGPFHQGLSVVLTVATALAAIAAVASLLRGRRAAGPAPGLPGPAGEGQRAVSRSRISA